MILGKNEVLDCISVDCTLNAHKDSFKKIVRYYVRDLNAQRRRFNKKERKQIMVEFGNLILSFYNPLLSVKLVFYYI